MKIEDHKKRLDESITLVEESIEKGIIERQRTIGFNTSAAAADMLEIFLHKKGLIDPGLSIKHEWLKSKNKTILVDIKNPMAAIDMGLLDLLKGKIKGSGSLKKLKDAGFKIKVKYKLFEFEL